MSRFGVKITTHRDVMDLIFNPGMRRFSDDPFEKN